MYTISQIVPVISADYLQQSSDDLILHLLYDSRRVQQPSSSLFFAIRSGHNDGHKYIRDAYKKGIRNFVVCIPVDTSGLTDCNFLHVADSLQALHDLAIFHRKQFTYPVIGITGSNGKTIVKEWLYLLLQNEYRIVRSPKSFNSQIGVPLSIWQMSSNHDLAIFEAGISRSGEMEKLASMIQPSIGILTNIGEAHSEGFLDKHQKLAEKLKLFDQCPELVARSKDLGGRSELLRKGTRLLTWGHAAGNSFVVTSVTQKQGGTEVAVQYNGTEFTFRIPFADHASVENAITCCCVLLLLGKSEAAIAEGISKLHAIDMRLQLNHSINNCLVINDSYSADITSLKIALDFLQQQSSGLARTVILSEFVESSERSQDLYASIAQLLQSYGITKAVVIGEKIIEELGRFGSAAFTLHPYLSTDDFIREFRSSSFFNEIILVKGARKFEFERIVKLFERKLHGTVLEINLNALVQNLKEYQRLLKPDTKVMAMVKAFSYGSGGAEIASVLQYHNTHYLGVAYADEGMELVKAGISLPVMVMNVEESSFQSIVDYNLQPVIYSPAIMQKFEYYLVQQGLSSYPVHLEIETGMNRLGFTLNEVERLAQEIADKKLFTVQSVFSHLAASEDPAQDDFTAQQADLFHQAVNKITNRIHYPFLKHISNSAAIVRHPQLQLDMVRLGIGIYGVEIDNDRLLDLHAVATLRSTIAQIKDLKKGESVSYNRKGVVHRDSRIATVRIGYADGYSRQFGNGRGKMLVRGQTVSVIGTVCMDMTMIDVTDIPAIREGEEVIIFGPQLPVQQVASWINTIPYELMTGISQRVKRIYFHE